MSGKFNRGVYDLLERGLPTNWKAMPNSTLSAWVKANPDIVRGDYHIFGNDKVCLTRNDEKITLHSVPFIETKHNPLHYWKLDEGPTETVWRDSGSGPHIDVPIITAPTMGVETIVGLGIEVAAKIPFDNVVTEALVNGLPVVEYTSGEVSHDIQRLWDFICEIFKGKVEG